MLRAVTPPRRDALELLDEPALVAADLAGNLEDLRFLNRWFGGTGPVVRHVRPFLRGPAPLTLLDVGTGSGDIPLAIVREARKHRVSVQASGLDRSPEVLREAQRFLVEGSIELRSGDARSLPFEDASFDLVTCCLTLHHFSERDARIVLREMWRVARSAVLIADLRRSYAAYLGTWLVTRTLARNRLTRHDGPLSTLRAYTPAELLDLARTAGWEGARLYRSPFFRQVLIAPRNHATH